MVGRVEAVGPAAVAAGAVEDPAADREEVAPVEDLVDLVVAGVVVVLLVVTVGLVVLVLAPTVAAILATIGCP